MLPYRCHDRLQTPCKAFIYGLFSKYFTTQTPTHKNLLLYKVGYLLYLKVRFCTVLVFFAYSLRRKYCHFIVTSQYRCSRSCMYDKLEVIYVFANIPYLLTVHRPHKLGGHNCL